MKHRVRFELCGKRGGYYVRFIAGNGREVWRTSETYIERNRALGSIEVIARDVIRTRSGDWPMWVFLGIEGVEIRDMTDKALAAKES